MTAFKQGDRVRLTGNAAFGLPDRRKKIGTVVRAWTDPTNLERLDVIFDGEEKQELGRQATSFEAAN